MYKAQLKCNSKSLVVLLFLLVIQTFSLYADTTVTILHTNDVHAWLSPKHKTKYGDDLGGLSRIYEYVKAVRKDNPNMLLLNAGDVFQGTPFYGVFKGEACLKGLEACGYDASTLGNHEFDNGLGNLLTQLGKVRLNLVCCNAHLRKTGKTIVPPFKVFFRGGKKIAVIGTIGLDAWESIGVEVKKPVFYRNQIQSVRATADLLRPVVDLVIVLSHSGLEYDEKMAAEINSIDFVVGGHSHTFLFQPKFVKNRKVSKFSNALDGTIVVQGGEHGMFVGKLDITLNEFDGISSYSAHLERIDEKYSVQSGNPVEAVLSSYKRKLDATMNKVIGYTDLELNYTTENKHISFSPIGNLATIAMNETGKSDICILNSGSIRSGIHAGNITVGDVYTALPFDNSVVTFKMKGADVKNMLDLMCSLYGDAPWYQCAGVSCKFEVKKNLATNIFIGGKVLEPEKVYSVSTSSFIASGNLKGDLLFKNTLGQKDSGIFMRDAVITYVKRINNVGNLTENGIKIVE